MRRPRSGPQGLHLDLYVATWAEDGLLAIFFVVAGLELKRELVGRRAAPRRRAMLPIVAALGGMIVPALVCLAVSRRRAGRRTAGPSRSRPTSRSRSPCSPSRPARCPQRAGLPALPRDSGRPRRDPADRGPLHARPVARPAGGGLPAARRLRSRCSGRVDRAWLSLRSGCWVLVHASGVHATVAGILLGLLTPVRPEPGEHEAPAQLLQHRMQPVSAGVAVPMFALAPPASRSPPPATRSATRSPSASSPAW